MNLGNHIGCHNFTQSQALDTPPADDDQSRDFYLDMSEQFDFNPRNF